MPKKSSKKSDINIKQFSEYLYSLINGLNLSIQEKFDYSKYNELKQEIYQKIDDRLNSIKILYNDLLLRWILLKRGIIPSLSGKEIKEEHIKSNLDQLLYYSKQFRIIDQQIFYLCNFYYKKSDNCWTQLHKVIKQIQKKSKNKTLKKLRLKSLTFGLIQVVDSMLLAEHEYNLGKKLWKNYSRVISKEQEIILKIINFLESKIMWKLSDLNLALIRFESKIYTDTFRERFRRLNMFGDYTSLIKLDKNHKKEIQNYFKKTQNLKK